MDLVHAKSPIGHSFHLLGILSLRPQLVQVN